MQKLNTNTGSGRAGTYVSKINVEQLSVFGEHDVVIVAVSNPKHVCSYAVPGAGAREVILDNFPTSVALQLPISNSCRGHIKLTGEASAYLLSH
jgi:hypothetical protein